MAKAVMISIRPEWVHKILSGEKTVEVRKTAPKLKTPFKCYIYCTLSGSNELFREVLNGDVAEWNRGKWADRKGNVVAEFVCNEIRCHTPALLIINTDAERTLDGSCLTRNAVVDYLRGNSDKLCDFYGWRISELKIYDKPKKLWEFTKYSEVDNRLCENGYECQYDYYDYSEDCRACGIDFDGDACPFIKMQRPPQSWCYVEDERCQLNNG